MKFKKLTAMFTALACASVLASSFGMMTSATEYDPCDVDHDGYVDILDVITVNRYLSGGYYLPNYSQLDANRNLIVDAADVDLIMSKILNQTCTSKKFFSRKKESSTGNGLVDFPSIPNNTFIGDDYVTSTTSRTYMRYSYISHSPLSDYTLCPSTDTLDLLRDYGIFDTDDRTVATNLPEYSGIVRFGHGGTGFIIDNHTIATAAHCVYSLGDAQNNVPAHFIDDIVIRNYNSDGTISSGNPLTPVEVHIPCQYPVNSAPATYDYALITVSEPLNNCVHFALGVSYDVTTDYFSDVPLYVTGCPGGYDAPNNGNLSQNLYTDEGNLCSNSTNGYALHYDIDTSGGQSGAPVYTITKQTIGGNTSNVYTALAIHTQPEDSSSNCGCRITKYQTQFYYGNPNVSY